MQVDKEQKMKTYNQKVSIIKDGKQKPIKGGGIRTSGKKQADELKSIDFLISYKDKDIGYITAKVCLGSGGHQDNVLDELIQYCEWSQIQLKSDNNKVYVILYDNLNTSNLYNDIKKKYKNDHILFTNTQKFKIDFVNWFSSYYKK